MAAQNPPVINVAYVTYLSLVSQANTKIFQGNPTLAAGDVKVAIDDGAPANLATLPVVDADFTKRVKVSLSAGEMNGDNISVLFSDAAGAEWCDLSLNIQTVAGVWNVGKTGYSLTQAFPANFSSLSISAGGLVDILQTAADKVWSSATRTLSAFSTALALSVWDVLESAIATASSIGLKVKNNLDDAITSRMATYAQPAGFLGTTFPAGAVASSAEVVAIQNNTRVVRVVPQVIERPDSGTTTYRIELLLYDDVGNMEAPDSAPTVALVNQAGTDLIARLDSATMALVSTGRYRAIYTASVGDTLEQLVWTFSVVEGGATRLYGNTSVIVDTTAVDFTAADRTKLDTLHDTRLTAARAANLDELGAANVPADIDTLLARLTVARAANLDEVTAPRMATLTDWIDGGRLDLILDARASQASVDIIDDFIDTEVAATLAAVDTEVASILSIVGTTGAVLTAAERNAIADAALVRQIIESYAANAVAPTVAQALMAVHQALMQFGIVGTAKTVRKLDNVTPAFVITHDSATAPTDAKRV